ncbi:hypothetical protein C1631_022855 [Chryseobacterium phosphatilyticum]|uniref:Conjugative transposon TraM C-terminal domain-containing protein n=1 Tax=Chryseobacterium phosphatilyticum TaxID=475075 RepID=A0A316WT59_9FLAO|nr:conjugative transposon protein TraM [Chryseobacterium phosphatilyticum]PWN62408.1 hypothetical protein C1631_022855 [Chryseobacterium phosphatilyticum]
MAINFQELIKDQKVKNALVIGGAVIVAAVFLYILFGGSSDPENVRNDKEVMIGDDASRLNFEVPSNHDSTLEGGTKIEAYDRKISDSISYAKRQNDAINQINLNNGTSSSSNNTDDGFTDVEFEQMRKRSLSNSQSSKPSPSNTHNTYGNSSMWSDDAPSGSNIGYSDLGNAIPKPQPKPRKKSSSPQAYQSQPVEDDNINFETQFVNPVPQTTQNVAKVGKSVKGKLISSGYATSGRSLSFVLLENFSVGTQQIKKGQVITGSCILNDNRLLVRFNTMKVGTQNLPVNARLIGYDGGEGLLIRGNSNTGNEAGSILKDEAQNQVSRIPVVGGILSRATSSGSSRNSENKIQLTNNVEVQIMFN